MENNNENKKTKKNIFTRGLDWVKGKAEQHPKLRKGLFYVGCFAAGAAVGIGGKALLSCLDLSGLPGFPDGDSAEDEADENTEKVEDKEEE